MSRRDGELAGLPCLGKALRLVGLAATHDYTPGRASGKRCRPPSWICAFVLWRDGGRCLKCAGVDVLELHHIKAVQDGGTDHPDNLATLCDLCHAEWTITEPEPYEEWLTLPPGRVLVGMLRRYLSGEGAHGWAIGLHATWRAFLQDRRGCPK